LATVHPTRAQESLVNDAARGSVTRLTGGLVFVEHIADRTPFVRCWVREGSLAVGSNCELDDEIDEERNESGSSVGVEQIFPRIAPCLDAPKSSRSQSDEATCALTNLSSGYMHNKPFINPNPNNWTGL
jgi:hypothetical protein